MSQKVQIKQEVLDGLVVKQAVRDIASKDLKTSREALLYFISDNFLICANEMTSHLMALLMQLRN